MYKINLISMILPSVIFLFLVFLQRSSGSVSTYDDNNGILLVEIPSASGKMEKYTYITTPNGCGCANTTCECCLKLDIPKIGFYFDGCGSVSLDKSADKIILIVSLNNHTIINETISAHNPLPVCIAAPYTFDVAQVCFRLYDLEYSPKFFKGCARIEGRLKKVDVVNIPLGCWEIDT